MDEVFVVQVQGPVFNSSEPKKMPGGCGDLFVVTALRRQRQGILEQGGSPEHSVSGSPGFNLMTRTQ